MNRKHTHAEYRQTIARLREIRPDIALSSDFIVGFPGETDQDFEDTMNIVRDMGYVQAFSFKYSIRPGTPAALMPNQVPEDVKDERLKRLQALIAQQQMAFNQSMVGKTIPVLIENKSPRNNTQFYGRSPYLQGVHVDGCSDGRERVDSNPVGTIIDVHITRATQNSLSGVIASNNNSSTYNVVDSHSNPQPKMAHA